MGAESGAPGGVCPAARHIVSALGICSWVVLVVARCGKEQYHSQETRTAKQQGNFHVPTAHTWTLFLPNIKGTRLLPSVWQNKVPGFASWPLGVPKLGVRELRPIRSAHAHGGTD